MKAMRRVTESDQRRAEASRQEIAERIRVRSKGDGEREAAPGLFLYHSVVPVGPLYGVTEPSFCVIVQGSKEILLGGERYRYDADRYLLISAGVPVVGHIVEATAQRPYLATRIVLDPATVSAVLVETGLLSAEPDDDIKALAVSRIDADLLDGVARMIRLLDTPEDIKALGPLIKRELIYRLLLSEQGGRLRQIAAVDGRTHRIARAIEHLRAHQGKPLRIEGVARQFGMSVSAFHHQFKAVTAMSPLQFQKQIRLQEARRLLLAGMADAAGAGYQVGYDDPAHFSREYKRMFGAPPMRDVERLRGTASRGAERVVRAGHP
jgi:AraC-like DNA-binding protein